MAAWWLDAAASSHPMKPEAARLLCDQSHVLKNKILDTFHPGCPFMPHDLGKGQLFPMVGAGSLVKDWESAQTKRQIPRTLAGGRDLMLK